MRCPYFRNCPYIFYDNLNYYPILNYNGIYIENEYRNVAEKENNQSTLETPISRVNLQGWVSLNGNWYYYENGIKTTGWRRLKWSGGTDWFYFDSNGAMATGWGLLKWSGGTNWFYFYNNGVMAHDTTVDGYKIGSNGVAEV
jgi:glucan-binding YG repeat protein